MDPIVTVTDTLSQDARAVISDGLDRHNHDQVGYWDGTPSAVLMCDPDTGAILGGLTGRTSLGLAFIDLVYLYPSLRGRGFGTRILQCAEAEAHRHGDRRRAAMMAAAAPDRVAAAGCKRSVGR